jgi:hypothetical protein
MILKYLVKTEKPEREFERENENQLIRKLRRTKTKKNPKVV